MVEDDPDIARLVRHALERAGHTVAEVGSGRDALTQVRTFAPDIVVLDVMLPDFDGFEICRALRTDAATSALPILMLTARGEEADRIKGLDLGADDYVTKPFSLRELTARVGALLRRAARPKPSIRLLEYGEIRMDLDRHEVLVAAEPVHLTAKEFLLLAHLIDHKGRVLSRDELLTNVWGYQYTGGTRTVDVHVRRLREKIPFLASALTTVKQFGYKLDDPRSSSS